MCFQGRWSLSVQGQFQLERLEGEDAFGKGKSRTCREQGLKPSG